MTTLETIVVIQAAVLAGAPLVGNLLAWVLRMTKHPLAAARVERVIPIALRLGQARTASDLVDAAEMVAHEVTTTAANTAARPTENGLVHVELAPTAPEASATVPPAPSAPPSITVLMLVLALAGCGAAEQVEHVVRVSSEVIAAGEPCLVAAYEADQRGCLSDPTDEERRACVARVRARWKPVVDALVELRDVRCGLEPQKCAAAK